MILLNILLSVAIGICIGLLPGAWYGYKMAQKRLAKVTVNNNGTMSITGTIYGEGSPEDVREGSSYDVETDTTTLPFILDCGFGSLEDEE